MAARRISFRARPAQLRLIRSYPQSFFYFCYGFATDCAVTKGDHALTDRLMT